MSTRTLGNYGEQLANLFLQNKGYTIVATNYYYQKAEIDIIATIANTLVFVEVKTRKGKQFGNPEQSVTKAKQKAMARAAEEYIYQNNFSGEIRYDIIAILIGEPPEILHIEDAFFPIF